MSRACTTLTSSRPGRSLIDGGKDDPASGHPCRVTTGLRIRIGREQTSSRTPHSWSLVLTHIPDGSPCGYFHIHSPNLIAIGWLDSQHSYSRGSCAESFLVHLADMLDKPWRRFVYRGFHECDLCPDETPAGPDTVNEVRLAGSVRRTSIGIHNLLVPGDVVVYAAPSTIIHYITAHGYRPPDEFMDAVMACPPQGSEEHLEQLRRIVPELVRS